MKKNNLLKMNKNQLESLLKDHHIIQFDEIDSTNTYLKNRSHDLPHQTLVIASSQTKGKGRNGRQFYSPDHQGIYMSYLLKSDLEIERLLSISALVGVALYNAIQEYYGLSVEIKWINDIVYKDLKLAGILCETDIDASSHKIKNLIIGIGINVSCQSFPDELKNIATSLQSHSDLDVDINEFIACIIRYIDQYLKTNDFMDIYRKHSYVLNEMITFSINNQTYEGKVIDILNDGSLIVDSQQLIHLNSGEISIRKKTS